MNKFVFIGGQPKGYPEAFSPKTRSGKILRGIVDETFKTCSYEPEIIYLDLWATQEEEDKGIISSEMVLKINDFHVKGFQLIALGVFVYEALYKNQYTRFLISLRMQFHPILYLPHPASRRKKDIAKLIEGIKNLRSKIWFKTEDSEKNYYRPTAFKVEFWPY